MPGNKDLLLAAYEVPARIVSPFKGHPLYRLGSKTNVEEPTPLGFMHGFVDRVSERVRDYYVTEARAKIFVAKHLGIDAALLDHILDGAKAASFKDRPATMRLLLAQAFIETQTAAAGAL